MTLHTQRDPPPAAAGLVEEIEGVMQSLSEQEYDPRMRLHGESNEQIAQVVSRTKRTLRRELSQIESCPYQKRLRQ